MGTTHRLGEAYARKEHQSCVKWSPNYGESILGDPNSQEIAKPKSRERPCHRGKGMSRGSPSNKGLSVIRSTCHWGVKVMGDQVIGCTSNGNPNQEKTLVMGSLGKRGASVMQSLSNAGAHVVGNLCKGEPMFGEPQIIEEPLSRGAQVVGTTYN